MQLSDASAACRSASQIHSLTFSLGLMSVSRLWDCLSFIIRFVILLTRDLGRVFLVVLLNMHPVCSACDRDGSRRYTVAHNGIPRVCFHWPRRTGTTGESLRNPNPQKPERKSMPARNRRTEVVNFPIVALSTFHVDVTESAVCYQNHEGLVHHGWDIWATKALRIEKQPRHLFQMATCTRS